MKQHQQDVFITVNRMIRNKDSSMDVCQNIFLKVYKNLCKFNFNSSFKTWLIKISINETLNWLRLNKKNLNLLPIENIEINVYSNDTDKLLIKKENSRLLYQAIFRLNNKYQQAIVLRYFENKSIKEIANVLSCSEGVVKNMLFRSLRKLKSFLIQMQ